MKRESKGGFEYDAFSKWGRRYLSTFSRPGRAKAAKQQANRRERRRERQLGIYRDENDVPHYRKPF